MTTIAAATTRPEKACVSAAPLDCLRRAVEDAGAAGDFVGVVLVARDGKPIWSGAYGERAGGERIQPTTQFDIASAGKMFTAVAVAQLVQKGKLDFQDQVGSHVPGLAPDVAGASIHQLLSHTSGLAMNSLSEGITDEPGVYHYSNAGFSLLASVVENVSHERFGDYLRKHVFEPAAMRSTGASSDDPGATLGGAGGEASTAPDLLRFGNALFSYRLLDRNTTRLVTSKKTATEFGAHGYGFGIFSGTHGEVASVGHIGVSPGTYAAVEMNPELGYTVIVLSERGFTAIQAALTAYQSAIGMGYWRG